MYTHFFIYVCQGHSGVAPNTGANRSWLAGGGRPDVANDLPADGLQEAAPGHRETASFAAAAGSQRLSTAWAKHAGV